MPQTVWKGTISFGLVSIPVRLSAATEERNISFRQVRASDGARVRYRRVAETDGSEVAYADIAKGYEMPDGDVVILSDEDLADLPVASSKVVDVHSFVPLDQIDPTALSRAYYAEPTADVKPYVLLRDALEASGRVAVVKVSLRNRERLAVLRPRDGVLVLQTMLWPDEVRRPEFRFLDDGVDVRPQEMAMAESYIATLSGDFDADEYVDEYRHALEEVVQAKIDGREVTRAPEQPEGGTVVDLMEALRRSVAEARRQRGEGGADDATDADEAPAPAAEATTGKATASKATAKRAPTKKAAGSKAPAKKAPAKKTAASRSAAGTKSTASKSTASKTAATKRTASKATAEKTPAKRPAAKGTAARARRSA
ncbi:MAG TPA: Ku protein [Jiangellales bacterium]|nr:Ku protein [Jiangellales bacterium]